MTTVSKAINPSNMKISTKLYAYLNCNIMIIRPSKGILRNTLNTRVIYENVQAALLHTVKVDGEHRFKHRKSLNKVLQNEFE